MGNGERLDVVPYCGSWRIGRRCERVQENKRIERVEDVEHNDGEGSNSEYNDSEYEFDDVEDDNLFKKSMQPDEDVGFEHIHGEGVRVEDTVDVDYDIEDDSEGVNLSDDIYSVEGFDCLDDPVFCVGMLFSTKNLLKQAIKNTAINDRVIITIQKNDRIRLRAVCTKPCK